MKSRNKVDKKPNEMKLMSNKNFNGRIHRDKYTEDTKLTNDLTLYAMLQNGFLEIYKVYATFFNFG